MSQELTYILTNCGSGLLQKQLITKATVLLNMGHVIIVYVNNM